MNTPSTPKHGASKHRTCEPLAESRWKQSLDTASGWCLIVGSLLLLAIMTHHPEPSGNSVSDYLGKVRAVAVATRVVHILALLSLLPMTLGFVRFAERLGWRFFLVRASAASFLFGVIAVLGAGTLNGLVFPELAERFADASATELEAIGPILSAFAAVAGVLAKMNVLAWCFAALLLVLPLLKRRFKLLALSAALSFAPAMGVIAKVLELDVHGYLLFVLFQTIWLVAVGVALLRGQFSNRGSTIPDQPSGV